MDLDIRLDLLQLRHHLLVYMQTSGCIYDHDIVTVLCRVLHRSLDDIDRFVVCAHRKEINLLPAGIHAQLLDCRRSVDITRDKQRFLAL